MVVRSISICMEVFNMVVLGKSICMDILHTLVLGRSICMDLFNTVVSESSIYLITSNTDFDAKKSIKQPFYALIMEVAIGLKTSIYRIFIQKEDETKK